MCEINTRQVANGDNIPSLSVYLSFPSAILGDCVRLARMCGTRHAWHNTWVYVANWRARERVREAVGCDISLSHCSIRQWYHTGRCLKQQKSCCATLKKEALQQWVGRGTRMLKHDNESGVMFCEWCCCFNRNEHRNQFVKGCASIKLESIWT